MERLYPAYKRHLAYLSYNLQWMIFNSLPPSFRRIVEGIDGA
jgi:hypothetical protein